MKYITSSDNPVWKQIRKLQKKKGRDVESCYLIEGFHLIREALDQQKGLKLVVFRESLLEEKTEEVEALQSSFEELGIRTFFSSDDSFDREADTESPQGILAVVERRDLTPGQFFTENTRKANGNIIVLDCLQDPGNVGTILRTADAAGFLGAIVVKGTADIYSPKVVRSASGSLFRLPLLFTESAQETLALLEAHGKEIAATTPYGSKDYYDCNIAGNTALIIGNEGAGVSELFLEKAHHRLKIPMEKNVESLNASVAAGILIYESVRQQKYPIDGGR